MTFLFNYLIYIYKYYFFNGAKPQFTDFVRKRGEASIYGLCPYRFVLKDGGYVEIYKGLIEFSSGMFGPDYHDIFVSFCVGSVEEIPEVLHSVLTTNLSKSYICFDNFGSKRIKVPYFTIRSHEFGHSQAVANDLREIIQAHVDSLMDKKQ